MIWLTSDLHLNHYNILNLERFNLNRFGLGYIKTLDQYNNMIISHINAKVMSQDTLYIVGDVGFGPCAEIKKLLDKIVCRNLILIFGNHDKYGIAQAKKIGFKEAIYGPYYLPESKGKILLSHYPSYEALYNPYLAYNLHGHLHGSKLDDDQFFNLNIAMNEYYPVKADDFLKRAESRAKKREEKFLSEWFIRKQVFIDKSRGDVEFGPDGKIIFPKDKK
ncbi:MAG: metallophosphoesterase [Methanobrevibacter sp.]|nr:metallophosphoesterase [Methanobrevibacter sp.]MBO7691943.1 metallophosphoesterase [Methanobrevibacter sp.]MBP5470135.1 metallophosphoesterase [Candidatus Riflebacteria bacterium]